MKTNKGLTQRERASKLQGVSPDMPRNRKERRRLLARIRAGEVVTLRRGA